VRVAILSRVSFPYHGYGGAERHIYHLIKYLSRQGIQLRLYTSPPKPGWREATFPFFREPQAKVKFVRGRLLPLGNRRGTVILDRAINYPFLALRMGNQVARDVKRGEVDLVYAQGVAGLGYAVRRRIGNLRAPIVYNPQGMEEFKTPNRAKRIGYAPLRFYARRTARWSDCVVASDDCMKGEVATLLRTATVRVLRNGLDMEESERFTLRAEQEALVQRFEMHETECIGVTVSRLEENKGVGILLRALHALDRDRRLTESNSWKWFIVGDGPLARSLSAQSSALGLEGRVIFTGRVGDMIVHNLYELADVFCLPSLFEGSSIATLEAMFHGCAIVASRIGGLPDKVIEGRNGYLTEPGSSESIAHALGDLIANRERRREMAEESVRRAKEKFAWGVVAREAITLFEEVVATARR